MEDDDDLIDFGPATQLDHRKAEVAKFKSAKPQKKLVKQNRHRWQSFNERLDGVKVDVLRRTGRDSERGNRSLLDEEFDEDFGSHFEAQLAKRGELNLTGDFSGFLRDVQSKVGSLALVLYNKDAILEALLARLATKGSLAIEPLCACLAALARDLRQEFYPFLLPRVLPVLLAVLDVQSADVLEDVFSCLAFLFKFLLRFVVDDFNAIFDVIFPVLRHKHWYIRKFCAEVVSFLLRKVPSDKLSAALAHTLDTAAAAMQPSAGEGLSVYAFATQRKEVEEGVSQLLFEAVKGIQNGFHSRYTSIATKLVALVPGHGKTAQQRSTGLRERRAVVGSFFARVCEHCRAEEAGILWDTFAAIVDEQFAAARNQAKGGDGAGRGREGSARKRHRGADDEENEVHDSHGVQGGATEALRFLAASVAHRDGSRLGASHVLPLMQRLHAGLELALGEGACKKGATKASGVGEGGGGERGGTLLENSMALGVCLLKFGEASVVEECVELWSGLLSVPLPRLAMPAALDLCRSGCCQGPIRSAVWALCVRLAEEHLESAMVLYDTLIKDTTHEPTAENVRAAGVVRAKVVAELSQGIPGRGGGKSAGGEGEGCERGGVKWLWLAVRVVGAGEGGISCEDVELERGVLEHLEKMVDAGVAMLRSTSAAARPPPSAYVDPEMKEIRREEKESKRAQEVLERAAARKGEEEVGLAQGRDAQVAALAMSCSHMNDDAALLVEATRALLTVAQAFLHAAQPNGSAKGGKQRSKSAPLQSGGAGVEAAGTAFEKAVTVVDVLLLKVPHYASTVEFLLEMVELEQATRAKGSALASLAQSVTFDRAYERLRMNLLTGDEHLRKSTLRLLLMLLPEAQHEWEAGAGYDLFAANPERATLQVMLDVEEAPMDAAHGKARILKLQQLQTAIESGKVPAKLQNALFPFFLGQLRCRFTLPWKQVREGLLTMAKHIPHHLWPGLLAHMSIAAGSVTFSSLKPKALPALAQHAAAAEDEDQEADGEEAADEEDLEGKVKQRRGKGAKKAHGAPKAAKVDLHVVPASQLLQERLASEVQAHSFSGTPQIDVLVQLLVTAAGDAKYLQNHSKYLVQLFLHFLALQYDPLFTEDQETLEPEDLEQLGYGGRASHKASYQELKAAGKKSRYQTYEDAAVATAAAPNTAVFGAAASEDVTYASGGAVAKMGRTDATRVLAGFLDVFANMTSGAPLYQAEVLRRVFTALLAKTHNQVQLLALRSLYLWKPEDVMPYKTHLENLIDDEKYRDELTFFTIDDDLGQVKEAHRPGLVPVLSRILYAKVVQRKVLGAKTSLAQRRATVLAFFAGMREEEFGVLVSIVFRPFRLVSDKPEDAQHNSAFLTALSSKKLLGFLNTLKDLVDQVGHRLTEHLPQMTSTLLALVAHVFASGSTCEAEEGDGAVDDAAEDDQSADYKQKLLKKLRGLCLRRVTDIVTKFKSSDFSAFVPRLLATLKQRIVRLPLENTQSPVGLLETFHEMAHNDSLAAHLFSDVEVLPAIFGCMAAPRAAYPVRKASLEIADKLVRQAQTLGLQDKMSAHMSVLLDNVYLHLKALVDNGGPSQAGDMQAQVREISLLRLQFYLLAELSRYQCTPQQAAQLLDLLIPFLSNRKKLGNVSASEESRKFILQTCANLVKLAPDSSVYVAPAARQLLPKMSEATRSAACDFILAIGSPLAKVSRYISELNAMSSERLDEYDFDKRLAAYAACCQPEFLSSLNADHVRVLAAQCMHDFREDDISVRNHGIKLLLLILGRIKEAATCKGGAATFQAGGGHVSSQLAGTAQGKGADMWEVYLDVIYPALKKNLTDRKRVLRNESFKMLINASREFTEFHGDLAVLSHVDPEQDISLNMLHMQMNRRIKAMKSLQNAVQGGGVSAATLRYILLPLVWWNIIEPESQDLSGNKVTKKDEGAYNLADEAVRAAGAIALQLPWKDYHVMLWDALRELSLSRPYEKVVIKLVCAIVTNFHFALDPTAEAQVSEFSHLLGLAGTSGGAAAASKTAKEDAAADSKRRQSEVAKRLDAGDNEDDDVDREEQEMVSSGVLKEPAGKALEVGGKVQALDKAVLSAGKTGDPGEVYLHVVYKLMPELEKHMTEKANATSEDKRVQQGKLRPAMAVAVVKILNLLPEERMRARLPHVIGVVCNGLRVREQSDRDAARGTLADIMRCLGPLFLNFVLGEVKSNLSLGFQRHVCGYTFFSLLDSLQDLLAGPHLLPSIPLILEVYFLELYGTVSEEKEVDKIVSKTREAKSTKAYDCIELIGKVLSFELFSPAVLEPEDHEWGLRAQIHAAATLKQRKRMEEMLRRLGLGLAANPSVTSKEMMLWVHKLVSHYLPACVPSNKKSKLELKEAKRKQAQKHFGVGGGAVGEAGQKRSQLLEKRPEPAEKLPPMGPEWERRSRAREGATMMEVSKLGDGESVSVNRNEYLLAELALTLLHTCLKRETVDLKVKAHMEMLNPFVAVTQKLMLSKHDTVVVLALKIFSLLLPLHLPATEEELPWALKNIFFLLQRGGSTSSLTMSGCFKALTVMLREAKGSVKLSQSQLKVLLSFAQQDILESGRQAVAFGLVRAIVARKLVCEEVYDLMDKIAEHMVTSQSEQTRALSAQTLIVFMLDFPMGDKRLHAHMTRLVRDLDYGYESGRKVVLEVMARLVTKLPQPVLDQYLELFFLPLVTRLINDDSSTCRKMVGLLIKQLLGRAARKQLDSLFDLIIEWIGGKESLLRRAAAQVMGLLVEQQGAGSERYMERVYAALSQAVSLALSTEETGGEWECIYHALTAAEKLHTAAKKLSFTPDYLQGSGQLLSARILHHRHPWVQLAAARLLGRALGGVDAEAAGGMKLRKLLAACGGAFVVVRGICAQVATAAFDGKLSEQVLRNLIHLCTALHKDPKLVKDEEVVAAEEDADKEADEDEEQEEAEEEEEVEEEGLAHEDAKKPAHVAANRRQPDDEDKEEEAAEAEWGKQNGTKKVNLTEGIKPHGEGGGAGAADEELEIVEPVRAVKWLFQRLSHIARRNNGQRRSCVFQFFAAMGMRMGAGALVPLLAQVTSPLYRAIEIDTQSPPELRGRDLAQEVVEVLQDVTGHERFYLAYNACRTRQRLRKDQRRSEKSLKKLLDPQGAAAARIGKNQRKVKSKKRKIEGHKEARGAKRQHYEKEDFEPGKNSFRAASGSTDL